MRLFFVINQHLPDGSAHALYCFRHCWWLAKTRPECQVRLVFPSGVDGEKAYAFYGLPPLPNLRLKSLLALRRARDGIGITIDLVYFFKLYRYLLGQSHPGDWLVSASFPKLFRFLQRWPALRARLRWGYEAHDLASLSAALSPLQLQVEDELLAGADCIFTTTQPLQRLLRQRLAKKPIHNVGLACGCSARDVAVPPANGGASFVLAYIGSVYREQGVEWLIQEWTGIRSALPVPARLEIVGGRSTEVDKLRRLAADLGAESVRCHGALPPAKLPGFLRAVDALVLPALPVGKMPFVAITKAYDYLGFNRPTLASNLATITEIMRPREEALVFEAGNAASLKAALLELINTPGLGQRLAGQASRRAAELSWAKRAELWWKCLTC